MTTSRTDHLTWCKNRALAYCDAGDVNQAFSSMVSDLRKEPSTADHVGIMLGMQQLTSGMLSTPRQMREYIEGFN